MKLRLVLAIWGGLVFFFTSSTGVQAQFWCSVWSTAQCRFAKVCEKNGFRQEQCSCVWTELTKMIPSDQQGVFVDLMEATPRQGASPAEMIEAENKRIALGVKGGPQFGQLMFVFADASMSAHARCGAKPR